MFYFHERSAPPPTEAELDDPGLSDLQVKEANESFIKAGSEFAKGGRYDPWNVSAETYDAGWGLEEEDRHRQITPPNLLPSQFTEFAFMMPGKKGNYENFSFKERRHMRRPYDTPAKRLLLFCGRQVEKSTLLGNRILSYTCLLPSFKTLYVSPSATQTKVFSDDRIKEALETSSILRRYTSHAFTQNKFEKQFINRSKITLRYAFLNADRCRGIAAYLLALDELQDIITNNIPIIEQCLSHAPEERKMFIYSGTPKGLDNPLEYYRSGTVNNKPMSSMGDWVVPCDCKGGEGGRYWNILTEKNIQRHGLSCENCGKKIDIAHPDCQWAHAYTDGLFESYRIPQLMVPWKPWDDILTDYEQYPRNKFYNEVLGLSYDSGSRPLTTGQVRAACNPDVSMHPLQLEKFRVEQRGHDIFAGIDWGGGGTENSYTVLSLGTYVNGIFRIFWVHRFVGQDVDPEIHLPKIQKILHAFGVRVCGVDYGGGFHGYSYLVRRFGQQRIQRYMYAARLKKKVEFDVKLQRWKVFRTEVMSDIFNAIKRRQIEFPRWEEFNDPYAKDLLNIFSEYNETLHMTQYQHRPDQPDDTLHSVLYCFLASQLIHPRPDIIVPKKEIDTVGPILSSHYGGPIDQGLEDHRGELFEEPALGEDAIGLPTTFPPAEIEVGHVAQVPGGVGQLCSELAFREARVELLEQHGQE